MQDLFPAKTSTASTSQTSSLRASSQASASGQKSLRLPKSPFFKSETKNEPAEDTTQSWKIVFILIGIAVVAVSALQIIRKQMGSIEGGVISAQIKPAEGVESVSDLDSDQDGIFDAKEAQLGTNPHNADTDNDGFNDGEEVFNGYNPLSAAIEGSQENAVKVFGQTEVVYDKLQNEYSPELGALTGSASAPTSSSDTSLFGSGDAKATNGVGGFGDGDADEIVMDSGAISDMLREVGTVTDYTLPDVSGLPFNLTSQGGKTAVENYMYAIYGIFSKYAPFKDETDVSNFITEVQQGNYSRAGAVMSAKEEGLAALEDVKVPQEMSDLHKKGLQLLVGGSDALLALQGVGGAGENQEKTITIFSEIQYLVDQTQAFVQDISNVSRKYDLPFVFE